MKNKFPPDRRSPVPLSPEEMATASATKNEHERGKIHRLLLTESMRRLRSGRTLEREHGVIHPEMTCIVRDVLRLTDLVFPGAAPPPETVDTPAAVLSEGCRTVASLVARHGHGKVAARLGVDAKAVKAWAQGETPTEAHQASLEARFRIARDAWGRT